MKVKYIPVRLFPREFTFSSYDVKIGLFKTKTKLKTPWFPDFVWTSWTIWYKLFLYIFYSLHDLIPWEVFALHCMSRTLHISEIIWLLLSTVPTFQSDEETNQKCTEMYTHVYFYHFRSGEFCFPSCYSKGRVFEIRIFSPDDDAVDRTIGYID